MRYRWVIVPGNSSSTMHRFGIPLGVLVFDGLLEFRELHSFTPHVQQIVVHAVRPPRSDNRPTIAHTCFEAAIHRLNEAEDVVLLLLQETRAIAIVHPLTLEGLPFGGNRIALIKTGPDPCAGAIPNSQQFLQPVY